MQNRFCSHFISLSKFIKAIFWIFLYFLSFCFHNTTLTLRKQATNRTAHSLIIKFTQAQVKWKKLNIYLIVKFIL
jgi:type II secretory pathway component PulF